MDAWDPDQYARFREERQQPFYDLLKGVAPKKGMRVVDLGCGTGELTREMHRQLKASSTRGVDSSETMLATAREQHEPSLEFTLGRIEEIALPDAGFDLVFSNAALHWVPHHASLFARLHAALVAGGQLAVQMPMNRDAPDHVICDQLLREAPYVDVLGGVGVRQYTLPVEQYATLLWKLGFRTQTVRLHVYGHKMASRDGVLEWVKGALLTDVKKRLPDELWQRFLAAYTSRLMDKLVDDKPYLYTMKRVFLWAEK